MNYVYVFLGGGLGSIVRFLLFQYFPLTSGSIPIATFISNIVSSMLIGYFSTHLLGDENVMQRNLLMTGFCGGFSTFSTFSLENMHFIQRGEYTLAAIYIGISTLLCITGVLLGMKLG
jgi:fluoride exporter